MKNPWPNYLLIAQAIENTDLRIVTVAAQRFIFWPREVVVNDAMLFDRAPQPTRFAHRHYGHLRSPKTPWLQADLHQDELGSPIPLLHT